jgi:ATP-dependent Clp protease ATP-binding subunit ClpX
LIGPTGTGKTLMVESMANALDVPYIICDAKRYTSNGYVGEDIESILVDLYRKCNEDMEKFQHGIIFIDEFDKLCEVKDERSHVNTTDVQESILKLLDGTIVNKTIRRGITEEHLSFDTSKVSFVLSGAFTEMFEKENIITDEILKKYGMISELAGRIGSKIVLNRPSKDNLKTLLLNGKYSYLKLFNTYLEMLNIEYEIKDEFIDYIVDFAFDLNLGYRGLEKAISSYVDEQLYDLISGDTKKLVYQKK